VYCTAVFRSLRQQFQVMKEILLYSWDHGTNNYKDTKPLKVAFFKKLTSKGFRRLVFICLRPPALCYTLSKYIPLSTSEKVRGAIVHKRGQKYQYD
jgi:hypothetical protein